MKFANLLVSASSSQDGRQNRPHNIVCFNKVVVCISVWNTYESIFLSALDVGDIGLATTYLGLLFFYTVHSKILTCSSMSAKLQVKFPKSSRVQRLVAMKFEALGMYIEISSCILLRLHQNNV